MGFINDMIHLTKGEFLIKYWYVYLVLFLLFSILSYFHYKAKKKQINKKYNALEDLFNKNLKL